ncbi:hypothetical protein NP493_1247g00020 [Ridgeia piscesae]|uniref:Uncharacterized protein n=1 Tax=Ridgeia piscesae TaxID=27915 RepID=A0AAD9KBG6_RIDPI|nr:hypothetical protein NP493_1247g00020 [Ridgeia piscesae]
MAQITAALAKLKTIWNYSNIALSSKIRLVRSLVMSIFLQACESWTLTADREKDTGHGDEMHQKAPRHHPPTETTALTKRCETELGKPLGPTKTS